MVEVPERVVAIAELLRHEARKGGFELVSAYGTDRTLTASVTRDGTTATRTWVDGEEWKGASL